MMNDHERERRRTELRAVLVRHAPALREFLGDLEEATVSLRADDGTILSEVGASFVDPPGLGQLYRAGKSLLAWDSGA